MTKDQQVNAVALRLKGVMGELHSFFDKLVGIGQHNIVLMVGAGDVVQFVSNTERAQSVVMIRDLLARWTIGLPDTLPGEASPVDTRAFEYLLNELEATGKPGGNSSHYPHARAELIGYVSGLIGKAAR